MRSPKHGSRDELVEDVEVALAFPRLDGARLLEEIVRDDASLGGAEPEARQREREREKRAGKSRAARVLVAKEAVRGSGRNTTVLWNTARIGPHT